MPGLLTQILGGSLSVLKMRSAHSFLAKLEAGAVGIEGDFGAQDGRTNGRVMLEMSAKQAALPAASSGSK